MRIGQVERDFVGVRIGRGKDVSSHRVYEATTGEVVDALSGVIDNAVEVTRIAIRQSGKGNKTQTFKVMGDTEAVAKKVLAALNAASTKTAKKK